MKFVKLSASWCQPCKTLAVRLDKLGLSEKVQELDVDTTVGKQFAIKYNLRSVPAIVNILTGEVLIGAVTDQELLDFLN
jgi:thioredoxin-like negative regulator of GroEL